MPVDDGSDARRRPDHEGGDTDPVALNLVPAVSVAVKSRSAGLSVANVKRIFGSSEIDMTVPMEVSQWPQNVGKSPTIITQDQPAPNSLPHRSNGRG